MVKAFSKAMSLLVATVFLLQVPLVVLNTNVAAQGLPPVATINSSISVRVDGVKFTELHDFTTELQNDPLWFPDVAETQVINPGGKFGVGKEYIQRSYFAGIPLDTHVIVKEASKYKSQYIEGTGFFATYSALYTYAPHNGSNAGVFTLTTTFTAPGLTPEALTYLLNLAMQNILDHYNTSGEITLNYMYIVE